MTAPKYCTRTLRRLVCCLLVTLGLSGLARAAEEQGLEHAYTNIDSTASLQHGAQIFTNYCLSCHSARYMRYRRLARDLDLTEDQVLDNLAPTTDKIYDMMTVAMDPKDAENWFGKAPPDLSLKARERGVDWIYTFLKSFYADPSTPSGWNNKLFPHVAMPNPLWRLQGIQQPVYEEVTGKSSIINGKLVYAQTKKVLKELKLAEPGTMKPEEFDQAVRDLVTFLEYVAEPSKGERHHLGIWVLLFLAFFALLTYLYKKAVWQDVH